MSDTIPGNPITWKQAFQAGGPGVHELLTLPDANVVLKKTKVRPSTRDPHCRPLTGSVFAPLCVQGLRSCVFFVWLSASECSRVHSHNPY